MDRSSEVQFADEKVKKAFDELKKSTTEDEQLYEWISRALVDTRNTTVFRRWYY
jgi:hypothetical protein